jgi:cyclophilin family peptidyl-prolyl cis-trans isomerase
VAKKSPMKTRAFLSLLILLVFLSCEKKKETIPVTKDNVREVLTAFGKANPEHEVLIETEYGNMRIRLYEETPLHRANFIKHIKEETYEDTEFYRIFYQFMIQAGIYPKELGYTIPAEYNKKYIHKKGALSMAQAEENNPNHESSASEFFIVQGSVYNESQVENDVYNFKLDLTPEQKQTYINVGGYMSLDQVYTVFGEVVEGLEVIDKIAEVKVYEQDKPLKKIPVRLTVVAE